MTKQKNTITPANNPGKAASPAETASPSKVPENEVDKYPSLIEIKELIEFVSKKEFNEFEFERGGLRLYWRKGVPESAPPSSRSPANAPQAAVENRPVDFVSAPLAAPQTAPASQEEKLHIVVSP